MITIILLVIGTGPMHKSNLAWHRTHRRISLRKFNDALEMTNFCSDLGSNDSYGTVVDMGMTVDGSPPRHGHYLHGGTATPPYLSGNHSPPSAHPALGHQFPYQGEGGLSVYTNLGTV